MKKDTGSVYAPDRLTPPWAKKPDDYCDWHSLRASDASTRLRWNTHQDSGDKNYFWSPLSGYYASEYKAAPIPRYSLLPGHQDLPDVKGGAFFGPFAGRGPKRFKRSDHALSEAVNNELTRHGLLDASAIEVTIKDGVVKLSGFVASRRDKFLAEDVVGLVPGVVDIENQLAIDAEKVLQTGQH